MAISLTTKLISELGNSSGSILPIWAKDVAQDSATTLVYSKKGGKHDGKEKAIEEYGTGLVWVCGIPFVKKIFDKTIYKKAKINPDFDIRKFKQGAEDSIDYALEKAKKFAVDQVGDLEKIKASKKLTQGLFIGKFIGATAISMAALGALIHLKQKTTEKSIKQKLISEKIVDDKINVTVNNDEFFSSFKGNAQKKANNPSFKGLSNFMYNPVWNMSILDAAISGTRLTKARKGERAEVLFKEASAVSFFYLLATPIQKGLEKISEKLFKIPIDLDYKVLADNEFVDAVKNGSLKNAIKDFKATPKEGVKVLDYVWENENGVLVNMLKKSGVVPTTKKGKISALKFMESGEVVDTIDKMDKFITKSSTETLEKFAKKAKGLKIGSIFANIGIAVAFLGIIQPLLAIKGRKLKGGSNENPAVKQVENKVKQDLNLV
ncbi:MAG: hypothetical protein E7Z91_07165 [Cyanobacteria bacterium SIG30]|nr:hypothetical protein [Cyanobacteria bacterium SIG30]